MFFAHHQDSRTDMHVGVIDNSALDDDLTYTICINIPKAWEKLSPPQTFGEHIRLARMKKGWQVKELALKVKVTPSSVINWEKRGFRPDYSVIRKLKEILPELASISPALIYKDYPAEPKTLGERLRQKRLGLDLSQKELAKKLGVCQDAVADWEAGRTRGGNKSSQFEKKLMQGIDAMSA